ncbi:MAG: hypothetical protein ACR2O4_12450 [Hyphomicrobiaceae bacterium]
MTLFIAALVLASALLHPVWNMLIKRAADPRLAFLCFTATLAACGLMHSLVTGENVLSALSIWPLILLSFAGQVLYGTCLSATLERGDLSIYYPIIRASPVFVVCVGLLFLDRHYAALTLAGIGLVVVGGFLLQYRRGARFLDDPLTLGFAVLAMCGTGIYSIADEQIMKTIAPSVQMFWIESLLIPIFFIRYVRQKNRQTEPLVTRLTPQRISWLIFPGLIGYLSYILILYAYKAGGEVAAVTSVRQASIPISVLLGGYFLNEKSLSRRLTASLVLALGIILVATTG